MRYKMATINLTYRKGKKLILVALLTLFITPNILTSQTHASQSIELQDAAVKNFRMGLQSDIYGIQKSLIYFAGKYRISQVNRDLLKLLKNSDNEELCEMLVWSLYQIGDDPSCKELRGILETHPSEKIRDYCKFLGNIREYEKEYEKALEFING